MNDAHRADAALSASRYDEAIELYTKALSVNRTAVKYYIGRATAYQRTTKHAESLKDAEMAVVLAKKRASRELIKDAQFRRAIALYHLGKFADALFILQKAKALDEKDKMLPIWEARIAAKLETVPEEEREPTVEETPVVEIPTDTAPAPSVKNAEPVRKQVTGQASNPPVPTPKDKIKTDWYQTHDTVTLTIMAKGIPKDRANVQIENDSVSISFPIEGTSSEYGYDVDPLYASIVSSESKFRITPNKLEVTMQKSSPGLKWHKLERPDGKSKDGSATAEQSKPIVTATPVDEPAPAYPTSSKSGAKNWDKVVVDDLGAEDLDGGDETSRFFKQLYSGATPEQQRAMMKSYSESGGTVLSTDWSNVGSKTVEPQPPDGMEAKKY
ncbi:SGT1 and CS domain containing [Pyrenophora seminiperda CCB06]|uniref:SGT1 and CS domain containing n=1 Tax=Pyrenophora seminiperda CCB06 TaxID=1302712 RepID=A0A3M7M0T1_9PLEO|nr:SGT1 and CS domain containing [Pyrenophora seminiperda CCB06]